jgi:hypothetical protein
LNDTGVLQRSTTVAIVVSLWVAALCKSRTSLKVARRNAQCQGNRFIGN